LDEREEFQEGDDHDFEGAGDGDALLTETDGNKTNEAA